MSDTNLACIKSLEFFRTRHARRKSRAQFFFELLCKELIFRIADATTSSPWGDKQMNRQRETAVLRALIREAILLEGAKTAKDALKEGMTLYISKNALRPLTIFLMKADPETGAEKEIGKIYVGHIDPVLGRCQPRTQDGKTLGTAWEVKWSSATEGWGPLLYDVAMEAAAMLDRTLTSDRDEVSSSAQRVWNYYATRRPDVIQGVLDDERGTLTPDIESDNCGQWMSKSIASDKGDPNKWHEEPVSRAYTVKKNYPNIRAFRQAGALKIFGYPERIFEQ